jgi:NAD-dependent deacetylase
MNEVRRAAALLADRARVLVFTGAGISTESGIPDFRGPNGVWTRVDPNEFTIGRYLANPETRRRSWRQRAESGVLDAEPNSAHRAVVGLWELGRMIGCVTQNIDGLHQRAGLPDDEVVELHGNAHHTVCVACGDRVPTEDVLIRVRAGDDDPDCRSCGGILKTDVIFFGEVLPAAATERAFDLAGRCDAVIAVGSTLSVYPAAYVPIEALQSGAHLVIINQGPTEMDDLATVRIEGPAGTALPDLVGRLGTTPASP